MRLRQEGDVWSALLLYGDSLWTKQR